MKTWGSALFGFLSVLCGIVSSGFGQIIENPAKPAAANAGRVVTLEEVLRLEDTGEGYFFKNPGPMRVSPRGEIFFKDGPEQALLFDSKGRFVRNFFKKGQGPGELNSVFDVWASPDRLYIYGMPLKILVFGYEGNLIREIPVRGRSLISRFILADPTGLLLHGSGRPDPSGGAGFRDVPWEIVAVAPDGSSQETIASFPIRTFVAIEAGGGMRWRSWSSLKAAALDGRTLFVNPSPEYLIGKFARDKKAVVLRFRRHYAREKWSERNGFWSPGEMGAAAPEFSPDIFELHVVDGRLWVQTWTVDEEKGNLFDIFDTEGRYVDSFYLRYPFKSEDGKPFPGRMTIAGGFAYFDEEMSDGLIVVRKCRLVGF